MNFVNAYFSHTKIWLYYVMFSSDPHYSAWHFPPPFFSHFPLLEGKTVFNYAWSFVFYPSPVSLRQQISVCIAGMLLESLCSPAKRRSRRGCEGQGAPAAKGGHLWVPRSPSTLVFSLHHQARSALTGGCSHGRWWLCPFPRGDLQPQLPVGSGHSATRWGLLFASTKSEMMMLWSIFFHFLVSEWFSVQRRWGDFVRFLISNNLEEEEGKK